MNNEATTTTIKLKMLCITITDCTNWHDENKVTGFAYCFLFGPVFVSQRKIKLQKREKFKTLNFLDFFLFIYYFFFFFAEGHTHTLPLHHVINIKSINTQITQIKTA